MSARVFQAMLLVLVSHVAMANPVETGKTRRLLSPPEIMEIVEKSDTLYNIAYSMEELENVNPANTAENLFPLSVQPLQNPWQIRKEDGSHELAEFAFSTEMATMFDEAESLFASQQYPEAIRSYQKIVNRFPDCPLAYAHLGDSYFKMKHYEKALRYFDKAIQLNPLDHRTFVYKADSLIELGRPAEAKAAYIHALSLRPRYWLAMANLRHLADTLGIEIRTDLFQPKVFVRREKDGIGVYISDEESLKVWLPYALVKAIWLGEPSHRNPQTDNSTYTWSSVEEAEALFNLIAVYKTLKHLDATKPDPKLDLLEKISDADDLPSFVLYEIASRMTPHITLTLPEDVRQSLREFIAKYVVVSTSPDKRANEANSTVAANVERSTGRKP
jgi:tetratricopeptide (TPR) repeat protein